MGGGYQPGTAITVTAEFTVGSDMPADPTTVTFNVRQPDGSLLTYLYGDADNVIRTAVGVYKCTLTPAMSGQFRYDAVGTGAVPLSLPGSFVVAESNVDTPAAPPPGPTLGPALSWITGEDVAGCCEVDYGQFSSTLDSVAIEASMALFEISGRQFSGMIERDVRPCNDRCGCWPSSMGGPWWWGMWPFGTAAYSWSGGGWWNERGDILGCAPMSRVRLAGYPVREIVQVLIAGEELPEFDPDDGSRNWRLDGYRYLTRMNKPGNPVEVRKWPSCQDMSLDPDQPGTFGVTYNWGIDPPQLGRDAACEIACQLYAACAGGSAGDCVLPAGVSKLVRQGVEIERGLLANWLDPTKPTGLVHVDLFLRSYWSTRARRRSAIWTPDVQQFARKLGS